MQQDYAPAPLTLLDGAPDDDIALMLAAQHDSAYFARVYERFFQRIYGYCLRSVGNASEAEDLTSQVFIYAFRGIAGYRGGSVAGWLFRIAYGTVVNHYRQSRPLVALDDHLPEIASDALEPLEVVMRSDSHRRLQALIDALPPDERQLLALKIEGELSSHEIGALLGKNPGAVRTQLHRILKRLRQLYTQGES
ncbi:MAG: sigma-70 family RNA polymerase sigma factor [Armatimonadetes bacterium]|nr:sigma-70 family RNA polymerase sigma factor [Anaerolineae bacterium]